MNATNDKALKEWSVICRALHEGRQVFLLTNGEEGLLAPENEFFLFPTCDQNAEDLQDKFKSWIDDSVRLRAPDGKLDIDTYAKVDSVVEVKKLAALKKIHPQTIWSESFLGKLWDSKAKPFVRVVFVRCFRYPHPHRIDSDPSYEGVISQVTLKQTLSPTKFYPVLSAEVFEEKKKRVLESLS